MREPEISVVIPVCERYDDVTALYLEYQTGVARVTTAYEFVFVLDGPHSDVLQALHRLVARGERITIIETTRAFGEATALTIGFEHVSGGTVMTLPAYFQIEALEIQRLVRALDGADVVVGHRWPRAGGWFESLRRRIFHGILGWVTHLHFHDLGCGARAMTRPVLAELQLYGDQHRFLPVLADRRGFRVRELDVRQSSRDACNRAYTPKDYARGFLDIFTVFFLVRFTKKPLRFFGMLGASMFGAGGLVLLYLVVQRLWNDQSLADRPALLLASLAVVFGLQLFALGLLGELIIFTHARDVKDYAVDRVIHYPAPDELRPTHSDADQLAAR
ncbi:MAG TPA: glycosyltransferase [Steroidobacteraceae bacterium]|nr:glycosyltransferase [Steroidobacteraceae bacterium]